MTLMSAGDAAGALAQYRQALAWRPALTLAARLGMRPAERRAIAEELAEAMVEPWCSRYHAPRHQHTFRTAFMTK